MDKYVLFFSHDRQIRWYSILAAMLRDEFGVSSKLFVIGKHDEAIGKSVEGFNEVINLASSQKGTPSLHEAREILTDLENRVGHQFFQRDMAMDRHFAQAGWSAEHKVLFGALLTKNMDSFVSQNGEPLFAIGEENTFPYRLARRILHCDYCIIHMVGHLKDRFYFEYSMYEQWRACINYYHKFKNNGVPDETQKEAEEVLDRFIEQRKQPADMELFLERGGNALSKKFSFAKVCRALKELVQINSGKIDYWDPKSYLAKDLSLSKKIKRAFNHYRVDKYFNQLALTKLPQSQRHAVYFAHVEPEHTIDGLAFEYRDQITTARLIAASLPADMVLLFKEHPAMVGERYRGYYKELVESHNIELLHHSVNSYDVIESADLLFTLTGSISLEAMFLGKPTIVLGDIYFTEFNGVHKIKNIKQIRETVYQVLNDECAGASRQDIVRALASMIAGSNAGRFSSRYTLSEMEEAGNVSDLREAFGGEFFNQ